MKALYTLLKGRYRASAKAYRKPPSQEAKLLAILRANEDSEYGRQYGFSSIRTEEQYKNQVPLVHYEALSPHMERIRNGEPGILTIEPVLLLEPTGGSGEKRKWVPYTKTLKAQFQNGVEAWLYDIYTNYPGTDGGKAYWMITPPFPEKEAEEAQVSVGFEDDGDYLGSWGKRLMDRLMIRPAITPGMSTEAFYQTTLRALLQEPDLRLISVWNPTLLLQLLDYLEENPNECTKGLSRKRTGIVRTALQEKAYQNIWPKLSLLSCWADATAASDAKRLAARLPEVVLQPKGLLSTECMVSFPTKESLAYGGMIPAWRSTYLEFLKEDTPFALEELEPNEVYEVITTTGGGLYRYRTGDRVRVTGRLGTLPLFRFEGRAHTVDLVGEKLTPGFVEVVFADLSEFYLLAPQGKGYILYTTAPITPQDAENRLRTNHHYLLARRLGQLSPVRVFQIAGDAERQYLNNCTRHGQKLGDIKPVRLSPRADFHFTGDFHD